MPRLEYLYKHDHEKLKAKKIARMKKWAKGKNYKMQGELNNRKDVGCVIFYVWKRFDAEINLWIALKFFSLFSKERFVSL